MIPPRLITLCVVALLLPPAAIGQPPRQAAAGSRAAPTTATAPQRTHDITVDDYLTVFLITECEVSPDGRHVAYSLLRWGDHDKPRFTDLWIVETASRRPTRLTFDPVSHNAPRWSADGQHIYFITRRTRGDDRPPYDGSPQVWVLGTQPGDPRPVTRAKGGVHAYEISSDGRTLYYLRGGKTGDLPWSEMRGKYTDIRFGDGPVTFSELWKLDLESWREERVYAPERVIRAFSVSPDASRVAMLTTPDARAITNEGWSCVDVLDVATGEVTTLPDETFREQAPSPYGWLENLAWSPDGRRLAWTVDFDGYPGEILLARWGDDGVRVDRLPRPGEFTVRGNLRWKPGTAELYFLAQRHARQHVLGLDVTRTADTQAIELLVPDTAVMAYDFAPDGRSFAYVLNTLEDAGDIWFAGPSGDERTGRLTRVNPQIDTWRLPQISIVSWEAPDGATVEGILELPPGYKTDDGPLPMIVELHGGPTDATLHRLRYWIYGRTIMAAKGYALLSPNYRGSTGYGDKFMTGLIGRENDIEVKDILAGVDAMIARGIADPDRLGVMGWSNGGYLVNCLITTTQRFKAASTGAGVMDMYMQWGLEDTPGHVINYMRGLPWERTQAYIQASPAYKAGAITTPTLIHVGEKDERVPAAHARSLYRALHDYSKTPAVLLVYPGAGHGLSISDHRKGKLDWDVAWFERYLLGKDN